MEEQIEVLKEILSSGNDYVEDSKEYLKKYKLIIEEINLKEIINSNDKFSWIIDRFQMEYGFKKYLVINDISQKEIYKNIINAVKKEIIQTEESVEWLLPLVVYLDYDQILYNELFSGNEINKGLKEFSLVVLRKFCFNIGVPTDLPSFNHEVKMVERYKIGNDYLDFRHIYEFVDSVEMGGRYLCNPFIELCSFIIANNYVDEYIKIINEKNDAFEIKLLIEKLSDSKKTEIGLGSGNYLVKFEVIRELVYFEKNEIDASLLLEISKIIIDFTDDFNVWVELIKYYLEYPSRSPLFFKSLGMALPLIGEEFILVLIKEIKIDIYSNEDSIKPINNCFKYDNLNIDAVKNNLRQIYERWESYIKNYSDNLSRIIITDVIDIVIFYIVDIMREDEYAAKYKKCAQLLNEIDNIWFDSKMNQISFLNKELSLLFALGFRLNHEIRSELLMDLKNNILLEEDTLKLIEYNWNHIENT